MKVTVLKGNLSTHKQVELAYVVNKLKDESGAKNSRNLREMLPFCSPEAAVLFVWK